MADLVSRGEEKRKEREHRIRELRQYGTTEDAENAALSLLTALPDDLPRVGIFASFEDVDDDQSGDGGMHFQHVEGDVCASVDIGANGAFEYCYAVKGSEYIEHTPTSAKDAAEFLVNRWLP